MGAQEIVLSCLHKDSFWILNKKLLEFTQTCDLDAVVVLTELISEHCFYQAGNLLTSDGYFFSTIRNLTNQLRGMSEYRQRSAIERLEKYAFIYTSARGHPKKRYFKINFEAIANALASVEVKETVQRVYDTSEEYYAMLNKAIYNMHYEDYILLTDNMAETLAFSIFYWSRVYQKYTTWKYVWSAKSVGMLRMWVKNKLRTGPIDYSKMNDYFSSLKKFKVNQEKELGNFAYWDKEQIDKPVSEREINYQKLLGRIGG